MKKISAIILIIAIVSQNCLSVNCLSQNQNETLFIMKQILRRMSQIKGKVNKQNDQIIRLTTMNLQNAMINIYLGPRLIEIFSGLVNILQDEDSFSEGFQNWANNYGINLLGMAAGSLLALQLCHLLSVTNPYIKVVSIVSMAYLGDKSVNIFKQYSNDAILKEADYREIMKKDRESYEEVIKFIKQHYLEITLDFLNNQK